MIWAFEEILSCKFSKKDEAIIQYNGGLFIRRIISVEEKIGENHCVRSRKYRR